MLKELAGRQLKGAIRDATGQAKRGREIPHYVPLLLNLEADSLYNHRLAWR